MGRPYPGTRRAHMVARLRGLGVHRCNGTECITSATGETCRSTPLAHGVGRELLAVLAPAVACVAVWVLLRRHCTRGEPVARRTAVVVAALFAVFCLLAVASVGLFLFPVALLLVLAVAATESPPPTTPTQ